MQLSTIKGSVCAFSALMMMGIAVSAIPAHARGGSSTGTGTTTVPPTPGVPYTVSMKLNNVKVVYNGVVPDGSVTLGYAADGSPQSMGISLRKLNVPDGTVLPVHSITGRQTIITTSYYSTYGIVYTELDGSITVSKGSATLQLDRSKGDIIPDFQAPTAIGTTEVRIYSADGGTLILDGSIGSFKP